MTAANAFVQIASTVGTTAIDTCIEEAHDRPGEEGEPKFTADVSGMEHAGRVVRARPGIAVHACFGPDALCICHTETACRVRVALCQAMCSGAILSTNGN